MIPHKAGKGTHRDVFQGTVSIGFLSPLIHQTIGGSLTHYIQYYNIFASGDEIFKKVIVSFHRCSCVKQGHRLTVTGQCLLDMSTLQKKTCRNF
jgi:hypothetical protein